MVGEAVGREALRPSPPPLFPPHLAPQLHHLLPARRLELSLGERGGPGCRLGELGRRAHRARAGGCAAAAASLPCAQTRATPNAPRLQAVCWPRCCVASPRQRRGELSPHAMHTDRVLLLLLLVLLLHNHPNHTHLHAQGAAGDGARRSGAGGERVGAQREGHGDGGGAAGPGGDAGGGGDDGASALRAGASGSVAYRDAEGWPLLALRPLPLQRCYLHLGVPPALLGGRGGRGVPPNYPRLNRCCAPCASPARHTQAACPPRRARGAARRRALPQDEGAKQ